LGVCYKRYENKNYKQSKSRDCAIPLSRGGAKGSEMAGVCYAGSRNAPLHPSRQGNFFAVYFHVI